MFGQKVKGKGASSKDGSLLIGQEKRLSFSGLTQA
jgi:hypothetical protein